MEEIKEKLMEEIKEKLMEYPYTIREASVKDGICNYSYEVTSGLGAGETHNVKGVNIVHSDMISAFARLRVHLALLDDIFKHAGLFDPKNPGELSQYKSHEYTDFYYVTGIKVRGSEESLSLTIIGSKYVSMAGGRQDITTPKIAIDALSSYSFWQKLAEDIERIQYEVSEYKGGKYSDDEDDEEKKPTSRQTNIMDGLTEEDFEKAKVK